MGQAGEWRVWPTKNHRDISPGLAVARAPPPRFFEAINAEDRQTERADGNEKKRRERERENKREKGSAGKKSPSLQEKRVHRGTQIPGGGGEHQRVKSAFAFRFDVLRIVGERSSSERPPVSAFSPFGRETHAIETSLRAAGGGGE